MTDGAVQDLDAYIGPWYTEAHVCGLLGIDATTAAQMCSQLRLLAVVFNDHQRYYPTRQFTAAGIVTGLAAVLQVLQGYGDSPETWAIWLAGPAERSNMPGSMWDALHAGELEHVLLTARHDVAAFNSP